MSPKHHIAEMDHLLANVAHLHHLRAHQLLESLGLYRGQPPVLFALWEQEGLTQTELSQRMKITPATITKMLQRMEKSGFIQRRPDEHDQRVTRVFLTSAGRLIQSQVEQVWRTLQADAFKDFNEDDLATARNLLTRVLRNLSSATGENPWE